MVFLFFGGVRERIQTWQKRVSIRRQLYKKYAFVDACAHYFSVSFSLYPYPYPSLVLEIHIYMLPTSICNVISTPLFNLVFMLWECLKNGLILIMLVLNSEKGELDLINHLPLTQDSDHRHWDTDTPPLRYRHRHTKFRRYLCFFFLLFISFMFLVFSFHYFLGKILLFYNILTYPLLRCL